MLPAPRFTVIIPFRNAAATLPDTLDSLAAQTCRDWEALLIDDASEDDGASLVQRAASIDSRISLIQIQEQVRPRGVAATRNLGLQRARGEIIAFLDADDLWHPDKLQRQNAKFEDGAEIVFSAYRRVDEKGRFLGLVAAKNQVAWSDALAGNPIGCLTGAYRRASFPDARMPEDVAMHEDYAFWLSLLRSGAVAEGIPDALGDYRVRAKSASANKLLAARAVWRILRHEKLTFTKRLAGFLGYVARGFRVRV